MGSESELRVEEREAEVTRGKKQRGEEKQCPTPNSESQEPEMTDEKKEPEKRPCRDNREWKRRLQEAQMASCSFEGMDYPSR